MTIRTPARVRRSTTYTGVLAAAVLTAATSACGPTGQSTSSTAGPISTVVSASPAASSTSGRAAASPTASPSMAAPAQAYVDAVNAGDLEALARAFAPDGEVRDVSRPIRGRDAIRTWAGNEVIGGRLQVLSVTAMPGGQDLLVHWAPAGSAGWRAHYRFTMTDSEITLADLQYA